MEALISFFSLRKVYIQTISSHKQGQPWKQRSPVATLEALQPFGLSGYNHHQLPAQNLNISYSILMQALK